MSPAFRRETNEASEIELELAHSLAWQPFGAKFRPSILGLQNAHHHHHRHRHRHHHINIHFTSHRIHSYNVHHWSVQLNFSHSRGVWRFAYSALGVFSAFRLLAQ